MRNHSRMHRSPSDDITRGCKSRSTVVFTSAGHISSKNVIKSAYKCWIRSKLVGHICFFLFFLCQIFRLLSNSASRPSVRKLHELSGRHFLSWTQRCHGDDSRRVTCRAETPGERFLVKPSQEEREGRKTCWWQKDGSITLTRSEASRF